MPDLRVPDIRENRLTSGRTTERVARMIATRAVPRGEHVRLGARISRRAQGGPGSQATTRPIRSYSSAGIVRALRLLEHHEGVRVNPVALHRLGGLVALHRFLKRAEVGDLED